MLEQPEILIDHFETVFSLNYICQAGAFLLSQVWRGLFKLGLLRASSGVLYRIIKAMAA